MRPQRIDLTGTTDAKGNATIKVPLPVTGEWFDLKFPLGMSGPGEWAVLASGTALTYGRGRRVTLGPELIRDGEVVQISVIGGPPNAAILGSAVGKSGSPEEILAGFTMSPNTISLDTSAPNFPVLTKKVLQPSQSTTISAVPILPGMHSLGFLQDDSTAGALEVTSVTGDQSNAFYYSGDVRFFVNDYSVLLLPGAQPVIDNTVTITFTNHALVSVTVWVIGVFDAEAPPVSPPVPAPNGTQQAQTTAQAANNAISNNTLVAGAATQVIRVWGWEIVTESISFCTIEDNSRSSPGNRIAVSSNAAVTQLSGNLGGPAIPVGAGLNFNIITIGAGTSRCAISYSLV